MSLAIPEFDPATENLPTGVHMATLDEIAERFGGTALRAELMAGFRDACGQLRRAGCNRVYLDGSFITQKTEPRDFDALWDATGVDPDRLDPVFLTFDNGRAAQKARFGGEFFPATSVATTAGEIFLDFFQHDREGRPKGIVAVELGVTAP